LTRVRIVLVGTQHPGNIGAAARAMKNMGLADLALVAPRAFPHSEAAAMASNASDVLDRARVYATLAEAVADCAYVVATTARPRSISVPVTTARDWAARVGAGACGGRVALIFGRERTGLTNRELDVAREIVVIPTIGEYASLNLAAAVQILSYELCVVAGGGIPRGEPHLPVDNEEMERFYAHLERVLVATRFLDPSNPRFLMRRLRRLFGRAAPDANEANILRGILTSVEESLRR
jgi:tRNA/rRNA methyltransferase/tRNA (cytidine32/uridine32-2'-O)-methyltransferase